MATRVYEVSKQLGIPTKEIIEALTAQGFEVRGHMSAVTDEALSFLMKKYSSAKVAQAPEAAKPHNDIGKKPQQGGKVPEQVQQSQKNNAALQGAPVQKPTQQVTRQSAQQSTQQPAQQKDARRAVAKQEPEVAPVLELRQMSVGDLSLAINIPVNEIILQLLQWGTARTKNQIIPEELVAKLAAHYAIEVVKPVLKSKELVRAEAQEGAVQQERLPVVVVLGHVDHGKTTLLDFIRKTRIAHKEKGGITQHLGAYEVKTPQGNVVFLDTPGHEAFSKMRMRGANAADIAILVVAADDSIKPQTLEAIKYIKAMKLPVIVAMNKVDKVAPERLEVVKRDLAQHDLLPEEWGGEVVCMPISGKVGTGIDALLEVIVLQSQLLELKADADAPARGYVLESNSERGRGAVATIMCQQGTLKVGDRFVCGNTHGRVSSLVNSYGERVQEAKPSVPVRVAGFEAMPEVGVAFEVVSEDQFRKARVAGASHSTMPARATAAVGAMSIIIKTDTNSSKEALLESIAKVSAKHAKGFDVISATVGNIVETDVQLAADSGAKLIGLHVKVESAAKILARQLNVTIQLYDVIYKLLETLDAAADSAKEVKMIRVKTGEATVRKVFPIKGVGVIAGCFVTDGVIPKDGIIVGWHGKNKLGEGKIKSLQRDKKSVKDVHAGFECGFLVDSIDEWQEGDKAECFVEKPEKKQ